MKQLFNKFSLVRHKDKNMGNSVRIKVMNISLLSITLHEVSNLETEVIVYFLLVP